MASSEFEELRHQACQLTADIEMNSELPRVERSLYQLKDMAVKMASKAPVDDPNTKASLLLGSRGFDLSKASEKLHSLSRLSNFEPLEPIQDVNVQAFLKNEYENALLAAVEQTKRSVFEEAAMLCWQSEEMQWEKQKQKVLATLCDFDATTVPSEKGLNETMRYSNNYYRSSRTSNSQQAYDNVICKYNSQVMEGGMNPSLASMFLDVALKLGDQPAIEVWTLMQSLVKIPSRSSSLAIVNQALAFLEKSYLDFMEGMVACNLQEARRGGVPCKYQLVLSYFNARRNTPYQGAEDGLLDGHPVWAVVYHCLRCGDRNAIARVVEKSRNLIGDFADVIKEYRGDRRLSAPRQREVKLRYRRSVSQSPDPYKRLVHCLVTRCDPQDDHSQVATTTDDYLWLKLSMVAEEEEEEEEDGREVGSERLSLRQLQALLCENYGESYFKAYEQPLLFSKLLLLVGQFESCVEFLFRFHPHRHLAVHIACTLLSHKLLHLPHNYHTHLLSRESTDPPLMRRLNVVHLISTFNCASETLQPLKALHYYYLLRSLKEPDSDTNLFVHHFCQLTISIRDYDLMVGQVQSDGSRKHALIDQFNVDADEVIGKVATEVEAQGHTLDAVRLYDLAKKHEKVLQLLMELLSQVLTQPPKPKVDQLKQMALEFAHRSPQHLPPSSALTSFHLLLDLSSFFQAFHAGDFQQAYHIMRELNLVSLSPGSMEATLRRTQSECREVRRCLPDLLVATAHCICHLSRQLTGSSNGSSVDEASKNNLLKDYRSQMQSLVCFSGSLTSRMPSHVTAQLVSLETSIK